MYTITREIAIDAAHRVPDHEGKCKNLHGHRYVIKATLSSLCVKTKGAENGMIVDFSMLKEIMAQEIDAPCDHGTIISSHDSDAGSVLFTDTTEYVEIAKQIQTFGYYSGNAALGKTYVVPFSPTAENLAKHWFERLDRRVNDFYPDALVSVEVFETPNCSAIFFNKSV